MKIYRCNETMITHSPTMKAVFDQLNGFGALVPVEIDYDAANAVLRADHQAAPYLAVAAVNAALGIGEDDE